MQAGSAERHPADPASGRILADRVVDYSRDHAVATYAERPASAAAAFGRAASGSPLEHSASAAYHPWVAAAAVAAFRVDIVQARVVSAWVAFPVDRGTIAGVVVAAAADNVELGVEVDQTVAAAAAAVVAELAAAAVGTVEEDSSVGPWAASAVPVLEVHP